MRLLNGKGVPSLCMILDIIYHLPLEFHLLGLLQVLPAIGPQATISGVSLSAILMFTMRGMDGPMWFVFTDHIQNLQHGWRADFCLHWITGNDSIQGY